MTIDDILQLIDEIPLRGFFVTADFTKISEETPQGIEEFLKEKYTAIQQGVAARKFAYQNAGWRIVFTFYPTDRVVDEKYAMKNKMIKNKLSSHEH